VTTSGCRSWRRVPGKTKTGRLWTHVRDERPFAGARPPAALFCYSPDRKGEHPRVHPNDFCGVIHADGYAGFNKLFASVRQQGATSSRIHPNLSSR
jgi:transposase